MARIEFCPPYFWLDFEINLNVRSMRFENCKNSKKLINSSFDLPFPPVFLHISGWEGNEGIKTFDILLFGR